MWRTLRRARHGLLHPTRYRLLNGLRKVESWPVERLQVHQQQAFDDIVRHAITHTVFYRHRYAARVPPGGSIDPATLPILTKADIRAAAGQMLNEQADRAAVAQGFTGGSTGEPLMFYYDALKHERMLAGMMRGFMMSGWRPGQRVLYLWGAGRDTRAGGVFGNTDNGLLTVERAVAADRYTTENLEAWSKLITAWRPALIYGYASALDELARHRLACQYPPPSGLLGVYSTAEPLAASQRERVQAAFGCHVFNQYGCREVPNIAWECRHGSLHVFSDLVKLETLDGTRDPRLLVTSLTDRLMPFIRYEIGDTGELMPAGCACGSPFPRLSMAICRSNDLLVMADGRKLHPSVLNRILYGVAGLGRYQWRQLSLRQLRLSVVSEKPLEAAVEHQIETAVRREIDPRMQVQIRYVGDLPRTAAGKHRFVIGLTEVDSV